jgi:eukaryotic-like serine/threonine-protein kinase
VEGGKTLGRWTGERASHPGDWALITETAQARVGGVLQDKYRLDALLGLGGMAAVYQAVDRNGERVAVKLLHPQLLSDDDIRKSFLREGFVANLIEHPGAVRVLEKDDPPGGPPYLVMELLEGETLQERLRQRDRLPEEEALVIIYRVLDVLAAAHARGILHLDIKPANVFITRDGGVKVLDFGLARLAGEASRVRMIRLDRKTTLGTPGFMAPERALGRSDDVDHQTDLWAVGATLFRLLTGRNVHEVVTPDEQMLTAATKPAPRLQSILPQASGQLAAVVDRALAFAKSDRWPDARHMQSAILPLLIGEGESIPPVQPPAPLDAESAAGAAHSAARPPWPNTARIASRRLAMSRLWWWPRALVVVSAVAAVLLGGWLVGRDPPTSVDARPTGHVDTERAPIRPSRVQVRPAPEETPIDSTDLLPDQDERPSAPAYTTPPRAYPSSSRRSRPARSSQSQLEERLLDRRH